MNSQNLETLFSTDYADIQLQANCLLVTWKQYADDADFRTCILKQIELVSEKNLYKILVDARKFRGTSIESRKFVNESFNALADKRGKHVLKALVVGDDVTGRFSLNKIVKDSVGKGKFYGVFNSVNEAQEWVNSHEPE
ncbi:MAG: hypothetical protein ACPGJS_14110 [Flammeovirgaceae bacterium]